MGEWVLGPYHPWLREPMVVRLELHGETVVEAELEPGYNRRGVEHLLGQATWEGALALAGRLADELERSSGESCELVSLFVDLGRGRTTDVAERARQAGLAPVLELLAER